ncbi:uncharacterized protein LOC142235368 [Haematobia irritans]|uniref:uncharacterized protein LOC142235368 n=1 Tax=Haematobia irritans TaxID=7368 RepID=UPI003F4FC83F
MSKNRPPSLFVSISLLLAIVIAANGAINRYVSHKNCNNVTKGKIIPHPTNCSQYIICNGLRSTLGECPNGLYYNAEMLSCDKWKATQCNGVKELEIPEKSQSSTTTTTKLEFTTARPISTTTFLPLYIDGRPLCSLWHDIQFPHPYHCEFYYECTKGFLTIHRCNQGYIWDLRVHRCLPKAIGQYTIINICRFPNDSAFGRDKCLDEHSNIDIYTNH